MPSPDLQLSEVRTLEPSQLRAFAAEVWDEREAEQVLSRWWWTNDLATAIAAVDPDNGRIAGICVAVPSRWLLPGGNETAAASICGWYVSPDYSGRGLGKTLVLALRDRAPAMNALSISEAAIRSFAKLGWAGPFATRLLLMPAPLLQRLRPRRSPGLSRRSYTASAADFPQALAAALDRIDDAKPPEQLRRSRSSAPWQAHIGCHPGRRYEFHVIEREGEPVGYFVIRATDSEAGRIYRLTRLHYVTDLVVNSEEAPLLDAVFAEIAAAAPASAGSLLLCTSTTSHAEAAVRRGWLSEESFGIGPRLASKAPKFMFGFGFAGLDPGNFHLTFADSDLDHNI